MAEGVHHSSPSPTLSPDRDHRRCWLDEAGSADRAIEVGRRTFASVEHHCALEPLPVEQAVLAGQARTGGVQDGVEDTSCVAPRHGPRQNQSQPHDPAVRMRRTGERQRRQRQVRGGRRPAVSAVATEPLGWRLQGTFAHQQAPQGRRQLQSGRQGNAPATDIEDDDARVEDRVRRGLGLRPSRTRVALPPAGSWPHRPSRPAIREPFRKLPLQVLDMSSLLARTSCVTAATSFADCRSKSISNRVSIRGAGEVPSLRLSKAIEGVPELLSPPLLEVRAVFLSELMELFLCRVQLRRVGLARQRDRADDDAIALLDPAAQVRQRPALSDEVIHHHVLAARCHLAFEGGLPRETAIAVSAGVWPDALSAKVAFGSSLLAFVAATGVTFPNEAGLPANWRRPSG